MIEALKNHEEAQDAVTAAEPRVAVRPPSFAVRNNYARHGKDWRKDFSGDRPCEVRQGRCPACKVVFYWRAGADLPLSAARCLECGKPLARTSQPSLRGGAYPLADHAHEAITGADRGRLLCGGSKPSAEERFEQAEKDYRRDVLAED